MNNLNWESPTTTPQVKVGTEKELWIAVEFTRNGKPSEVITFLAQYQNRPYKLGDEEELDEDNLVNTDGEYVDSVGWVTCQSHYEFDNYYELLTFNDNYKLLGWAEYTPPEFNIDGIK